MFRSIPGFGIRPRARLATSRRSHALRASFEAVEDRTLMSTLSSVTFGSHVVVYGIGSDGYVYGSEDGGSVQWVGSQAKQVSVGLDAAGYPEYYTINPQNQVVYGDVGGPVGLWPSAVGTLTNFATAISATRNDTLFFIGPANSVDEVVGAERGAGASVYPLFGYARQISAGLDAYGRAEVFAIGGDGSVYVDDNRQGWVDLDFYASAISAAATGNAVYAIGYQDAVSVDRGSGFTSLGGAALAISAGTDWNGNPDVYAIGGSNAVYVNDGDGWGSWGGYATELSATSTTILFARGQDPGSISVATALSSWRSLGNIGGANPNAVNAGTWGGYVAETNLNAPQQNSVTYVSASWVVPTGTSAGSVWVGIDGRKSSTVEQVGTAKGLNGGGSVNYAWWEMYPLPQQRITSMWISPGDVISADVQYITSGVFAGYFWLSITDESRANDSFGTLEPASASGLVPQRNSAEWIVEDRTTGPVYFADATAVINGISGPISSPFWQSQALNLGANGSAPVDTTSILTNSGDAFVVNPNATPGVIGLNLMTAVPTSPMFNGPDLAGPAAQDRPRPCAAANVQDTVASRARPATRPAIAIDRRGTDQAENVQDTAAGRTRTFRPTRMGSHRVH